jgi:hypothetical protein
MSKLFEFLKEELNSKKQLEIGEDTSELEDLYPEVRAENQVYENQRPKS